MKHINSVKIVNFVEFKLFKIKKIIGENITKMIKSLIYQRGPLIGKGKIIVPLWKKKQVIRDVIFVNGKLLYLI